MTKRLLTADDIFHFLELPDDMINLILKPLCKNNGLKLIFSFLRLNKEYEKRFARLIPFLYDEGYSATIDKEGKIGGVHPKIVARYMASKIHCLDLVNDVSCRLKGDVLTGFYNVVHLVLRNMKYISVEPHLMKLSRLSCLELPKQGSNDFHVYPNIHLLTNLKSLVLLQNSSISDNELNKMTNLVTLDLSYNWEITYNGIHSLTNLRELWITDGSNVHRDRCYTKLGDLDYHVGYSNYLSYRYFKNHL